MPLLFIGEQVYVRTDLRRDCGYYMYDDPFVRDNCTDRMLELSGKLVTISAYVGGGDTEYRIAEDPDGYYWTDEMLRPWRDKHPI